MTRDMSSQHILAGKRLKQIGKPFLQIRIYKSFVDYLPLERRQQAYGVGQDAPHLVAADSILDAIRHILGLQHGHHARPDAGEHARVDVIRTDQTHLDLIIAMSLQVR